MSTVGRTIMVIRASKDVECTSSTLSGGWGVKVNRGLHIILPYLTITLPREPLISTSLPSYLWERIAADLFNLKGSTYLLVVDYYSRFMEEQKLNTTTFSSVVTPLKYIFARFRIPTTLIMDNNLILTR